MTYDKHDCDLMCERLSAYIEGDLAPAEQARGGAAPRGMRGVRRGAGRASRDCGRSGAAAAARSLARPVGRHRGTDLDTPSRIWTATRHRRAPRAAAAVAVRASPRRAHRGERGHHLSAHAAPGHDGLAPGDRRHDHPHAPQQNSHRPRLLPAPAPAYVQQTTPPRSHHPRVAHHEQEKRERHPCVRSRDRAARQRRAHAS